MSKLKSSFAAKAVAVFLLAVMGIVFVGSLIGVGMMADAGGYAGSANTLTSGHIDPKWRKLKGGPLLGPVF